MAQVVRTACRERNAALHEVDFSQLRLLKNSIEGQRFSYRQWEDLHIRLLGLHQLKNAAVVLETVAVLRGRGWNISDEAARRGLSEARWPGPVSYTHLDVYKRQILRSLASAAAATTWSTAWCRLERRVWNLLR